MRPDQAAEIGFVGAARMELDELLEQLIERARDVQETQSRLRGLLRAYQVIARADDLDVVLRHVVEAARELVNSRYAALGVVSRGRLTRFVHTGMDEGTVAAIGHLPEGKGLLGLLVDYPQTLRLRDIADHVASVGFPDNHPPMRSFLGVPIRLGDRVFGNLYLTEKRECEEFTSDDEELVRALAGAAATAIENAMLLDETRRRQQWQAAMIEIVTGLLGGDDPDEALRSLVRHAQETLAADGAGVSMPTEGGDGWRLAVTSGSFTPWQGAEIPVEGSVTGAAIAAGGPIVVDDPSTGGRAISPGEVPAGPVGHSIGVPLYATRGVLGVLVASRAAGTEPFDHIDRDVIVAIAAQAGLALELAEVRRDNEVLRLAEDRADIADRLRQQVIERLFQHALALQGLAARAAGGPMQPSLQGQVDEVDEIIKDIRSAVFGIDDEDIPPGQP